MNETLINEFRDYLLSEGKSKSTVTAYTKDIEQIAQMSEVELAKLNKAQIKQTLDKLQEKHNFSNKTVSRKINSIRTFFRYLVDKGVIKTNPAEKVDHPEIKSKPPRVLSQLEYLALREVSRDNPRLHAMIELMLQTGLRIGEVSRLKVKHASLDEEGHLQIEKYSTIEERKIPLNTKAKRILNEYLADHHGQQATEAPLFPTRDGNHIIIRNIRSSIDRAMQKAGIEDACVNDLRNTFIVNQLKAGLPIDKIADVVGHKSKSTTQKYVDLLNEDYTPAGSSQLVEL